MVSRRDPLDGCSLFSACVAPRSPRGRSSMSPSPVLSPLKRCQVSPKTKDQKHCNTGSIQRVGGPGRSRDTAHPSFLPSSFLSSFIHSLCYCLFLFLSLPFLPSYFFYFFYFLLYPGLFCPTAWVVRTDPAALGVTRGSQRPVVRERCLLVLMKHSLQPLQ